MEWNNENALKLIDAYRARKFLWNHKHDDYKNRKKRFNALCELAEEFTTTTIEIERKLKNLTSHYYREQKKIKYSKRSNSGIGCGYQSKWFAFKSLSFLHNKFTIAKKTDTSELSEINKKSEEPHSENSNAAILKRYASKKRPKVGSSVLKKNAVQKQKRDEDVQFANYVTGQLKKMSKSTKTLVENHIKRIINEVNMGTDLESAINACATVTSDRLIAMKPEEAQSVEEPTLQFTPYITPNLYSFVAPDSQTDITEDLHTNNNKEEYHTNKIKEEYQNNKIKEEYHNNKIKEEYTNKIKEEYHTNKIKEEYHTNKIKEELVYMLTEHDYT